MAVIIVIIVTTTTTSTTIHGTATNTRMLHSSLFSQGGASGDLNKNVYDKFWRPCGN
jgi:hypothetical protein